MVYYPPGSKVYSTTPRQPTLKKFDITQPRDTYNTAIARNTQMNNRGSIYSGPSSTRRTTTNTSMPSTKRRKRYDDYNLYSSKKKTKSFWL